MGPFLQHAPTPVKLRHWTPLREGAVHEERVSIRASHASEATKTERDHAHDSMQLLKHEGVEEHSGAACSKKHVDDALVVEHAPTAKARRRAGVRGVWSHRAWVVPDEVERSGSATPRQMPVLLVTPILLEIVGCASRVVRRSIADTHGATTQAGAGAAKPSSTLSLSKSAQTHRHTHTRTKKGGKTQKQYACTWCKPD